MKFEHRKSNTLEMNGTSTGKGEKNKESARKSCQFGWKCCKSNVQLQFLQFIPCVLCFTFYILFGVRSDKMSGKLFDFFLTSYFMSQEWQGYNVKVFVQVLNLQKRKQKIS